MNWKANAWWPIIGLMVSAYNRKKETLMANHARERRHRVTIPIAAPRGPRRWGRSASMLKLL